MALNQYVFDYSDLAEPEIDALKKELERWGYTGVHDVLGEPVCYCYLEDGITPKDLVIPAGCRWRPDSSDR